LIFSGMSPCLTFSPAIILSVEWNGIAAQPFFFSLLQSYCHFVSSWYLVPATIVNCREWWCFTQQSSVSSPHYLVEDNHSDHLLVSVHGHMFQRFRFSAVTELSGFGKEFCVAIS
jgi:hypothetical protein